jgi:hypothetical protein
MLPFLPLATVRLVPLLRSLLRSYLGIGLGLAGLLLTLALPGAFAAPPASPTEPAPAIESYLLAGKFADGEAAMAALLQANPNNDQARFSLGVAHFLGSVERLGQSLHRYGLRQTTFTRFLPFIRLPIPPNPNPAPLRYSDTRQVLQTFINDLASVDATLAPIKDTAVKLPLRFGLIKMDLNGDGQFAPEESFWRVFEAVNRTGIAEAQARAFSIAFDAGDAVWLRGYTHLLSAALEFGLAHDGETFFNALAHTMFEKPETPFPFLLKGRPDSLSSWDPTELSDIVAFFHLLNFPVQEPARMAKALQHLQTVTQLSRQSWALIQAETDRDREWLPNPQQPSVIPDTRVTQPMIDSWLAFLDEADNLLAGNTLLPFWRPLEPRGINLNKVFTQPRRATDVILWIQGTGAAPYLEFGKVTQPGVWQRLRETFGRQLLGFAAWFN